eukprot:g18999.t1
MIVPTTRKTVRNSHEEKVSPSGFCGKRSRVDRSGSSQAYVTTDSNSHHSMSTSMGASFVTNLAPTSADGGWCAAEVLRVLARSFLCLVSSGLNITMEGLEGIDDGADLDLSHLGAAEVLEWMSKAQTMLQQGESQDSQHGLFSEEELLDNADSDK